ncbi:S1 family peptidase [Stackebrandtia soli]|uniref:S1 family peptidase n=1 Tax=Stackebrandtia soli TaxID=1892856 RepID=UPI0039E9AC16
MSPRPILTKALAVVGMSLLALAATALSLPAHAATPSPAAIDSDGDPGTTIVGGGPVNDPKPWIAALHNGGAFTCTSSQIGSEWIITAAHCVEGGGNYSVRIGSLDRSSGGTERAVSEVHMHPDYAWPLNDIALLRLAQPFDNEYAPMANSADVQLGQASTIYGWGSENADWSGPLPERLKYSNGVTSTEGCQTTNVICMVGDGGVAGGDSGGPGFVQSPVTGEYVLAGVCAIGYKPTDGRWSGYTSIPANADWINQVSGL